MLQGIRVLDFSRVLSGPFCTRILSDLGAEIIKVESLSGDPMRGSWPAKGEFSSFFTQFNAGKKSISINLKDPQGIELVKTLAAKCDVLIENYRPGLMREIGLGYDTMQELKPDLIYCSISGFGQTGSESSRLAYTDIVQAFSGLDYAAGNMYGSNGNPPGFPVSLGDTYASLNSAIAILAALFNRQLTGQGQYIDISMLDCLVSANDSFLQKFIFTGGEDDIPTLVFRPPFKMKDGHLAASVALNFEKTTQAIGRQELIEDDLFKTPEARREHFEIYIEIVKEWALTKTVNEAIAVFDQFDIPYSKVNSTADIINNPVLRDRDMLVDVDLPAAGRVSVINTPFKFSGQARLPQGPPPRLGEHNGPVLSELLDMTEDEIMELSQAGIISKTL
jgi:CoA:oxalate CoA-transferase